MHPHRLPVDRLDLRDRLLGMGVAPGDGRVNLRLPGPAHILGRERRTVAPGDVGPQVQRQRQPVVGPLVALDKLRCHRRRVVGIVGLLLEQPEEQLPMNRAREARVVADQWVDAADIVTGADDQRAAGCRSGRRYARRALPGNRRAAFVAGVRTTAARCRQQERAQQKGRCGRRRGWGSGAAEHSNPILKIRFLR